VLPNEKILATGLFTEYNGQAFKRIVRLQPDGQIDSSFDPGKGANGSIWDLAVQADGKVVVAGDFSKFDGRARPGIARLHADGSLDTAFHPDFGPNTFIYAMAVQADNKIVIGGYMEDLDDIEMPYLIRLQPDGSIDMLFDPFLINRPPNFMVIQKDGKFLLGGSLSMLNISDNAYLIRLNSDGSLDSLYKIGRGLNYRVTSAATLKSGKILAGGWFTKVQGASRNFIVQLNADGSLDTLFNPILGPNDIVNGLAVQEDGKILVVGDFTEYDGVSRRFIARLHPDGSLDPSFHHKDVGLVGLLIAVGLQQDGKMVVGGDYNDLDNNELNLVRLHNDHTGIVESWVPLAEMHAYPNPTSGNALLPITLQAPAAVRVQVTDMLGREVHSADLGLLPAGTANVELKTSGLNSGMYLYKVFVGKGYLSGNLMVE
jgi:uncharacterized delta-60 repeat protein